MERLCENIHLLTAGNTRTQTPRKHTHATRNPRTVAQAPEPPCVRPTKKHRNAFLYGIGVPMTLNYVEVPLN